jgi:integrase
MWGDADVLDFVGWLRSHNDSGRDGQEPIGFYGLDLFLRTLAQHVRWGKTEGLGLGELEWLFPNDEGYVMDESRVRKVFKRTLKTAKLSEFRLYDLRHTYASLLLAASAPITYVSAQLGHANPATTLRFYAR